MSPLTPALPASLVRTDMLPDEVIVPTPVDIESEPPVAPLPSPLVNDIKPP